MNNEGKLAELYDNFECSLYFTLTAKNICYPNTAEGASKTLKYVFNPCSTDKPMVKKLMEYYEKAWKSWDSSYKENYASIDDNIRKTAATILGR